MNCYFTNILPWNSGLENDVLKELEKNLQKDWKYSGIMSYNK
ncbi:hypothetical protein COPCOM_00724 [Coprococcus comes ATCC 27758]|uniref:Uncharacterized protein n=1 Tax=Coprococcus comes ATCC 27758 TaxID=470146 RepID=C0B6F2_9FIRM|nr:hypothetical protein COPCOM_00724 [Coprococcus comes ATCC 27758]